jgi:hypothetical protein
MTDITTVAVTINSLLPSIIVKDKLITDCLSSTDWTLIVCGKEKIKFQIPQLKILHVPEKSYDFRYILVKPNHHVAMMENSISQPMVIHHLKTAR